MRMVLWTGEEEGYFGAQQYYNRHKANAGNFSLVMESDIGTFTPLGISFEGTKNATLVMKEIMRLLEVINASKLTETNVDGDIEWWTLDGVPGGSLDNANGKYFYFHHTNGDTMTVEDPDNLDLCAAVWAVVAYCVADLDDMLPRE